MNTLDAESVDLVVTSPPYNIGVPYNLYSDDLPYNHYLNWIAEWCSSVKRLMHKQSSLFLNVGGSLRKPLTPHDILQVATKYFVLQNEIIWVKSIYIPEAVHRDAPSSTKGHSFGHFKPVPGRRFLNNTHEFIFHLSLDGRVELDRERVGAPYVHPSNLTRWKTQRTKRCAGNVWYIPYDTRCEGAKHPATFPIALAERCINLHFGRSNGLVLDPFAGIGSVALAALRTNKKSISIEMDETYLSEAQNALNIEVERIRMRQKRVVEYGD